MIQEILAIIFLSLGAAFLLIGSIGVIRLPDFFCRAHAMSKPDTMGLFLTLTGIALLTGFSLDTFKLIFVALFISIANPAATHALVRAALKTGLRPWTKKRKPI